MGWAGDLDGDGSPDLVFGAHYEPVAQHGSEILCFSQRGEVKWRFRTGRKLVHAQREELSENFSLKRLAVFANRHGERRIVFVGNESKYYPAQVGVLTPAGRLAGEYFHSGALAGLGVLDMDGDGVPEILLAGTNNSGDGGATLLALDSEKVFGASAEDPLHTLHGLGPAQEKLRIRFPLSCLDRKFGYRPGINVLDVQPGEMGAIVEDWNGSGLFYHFTRGGRLKALVVGDIWRQKHATAFAEGKIDHQFNPAEEAALAQLTYLRGPM
jgi:hypothetical protein